MSAFESWRPEMEPELRTNPGLLGILAELSGREPIFHRPAFGASRADFEKMTAKSFWEVGASGRSYSRKYVLGELEKRCLVAHEDSWLANEFYGLRLANGIYLLTCTLLQNNERLTRRSTIWHDTPEGWKIVFHQGTLVQDR